MAKACGTMFLHRLFDLGLLSAFDTDEPESTRDARDPSATGDARPVCSLLWRGRKACGEDEKHRQFGGSTGSCGVSWK